MVLLVNFDELLLQTDHFHLQGLLSKGLGLARFGFLSRALEMVVLCFENLQALLKL